MVLPGTLRGNEGCAEPGKASRDLSRTRTAKTQPCQHALGTWGPRRHSCRALRARCAQSTGPRGSKGRLHQSTCSQGSALQGKNQPGGDKAPYRVGTASGGQRTGRPRHMQTPGGRPGPGAGSGRGRGWTPSPPCTNTPAPHLSQAAHQGEGEGATRARSMKSWKLGPQRGAARALGTG